MEDFLKKYKDKILILNVKEECLEKRLIELMKLFKIKNYFFWINHFPSLSKQQIQVKIDTL